MRYVEARFDEFQRDKAYRSYVTMSLQLIPQNKYITISFEEFLHPEKIEVDERSGDEIAEDIILRAGITFGS